MEASKYPEKYITARQAVLDVLADGAWHTWRELETAGGNRYGARLDELRAEGALIDDEDLATDGKRYRLLGTKVAPRSRRVRVYLESGDARELAAGKVTLFARAAAKKALSARGGR